MADLVILKENKEIKRLSLPPQTLTIGRRPESSIILPDLTVSREHACLHFDRDRRCWQIENKSHKNPVRVNELPIARPQILFDGDRIDVGIFTLVFSEDTTRPAGTTG